ncbi:ABC transporter ATP-binding protein [Gracilinema caldarium]|uniref:ABC transporter ATP-binding protein n=1 Tax=Gracilinema caldarium TaxID=215591 RepID=UPI0026EEF71D|nr:ABC transporter ATP-binding protein [Gracilinema caldarium]
MLKLMNYLKPYWLSILAVLILLFVQANFDLALPDYMSRIVNEGIQQRGIESPVPRVLSETSFIQLHRVLNDTESSLVVMVYRKVPRDQVRDVPLKLDNPEKTNSNVYVLGPVSKAEQTELEQIMARSLSAITLMQKMPAAGMGQNRDVPSNSISEMDVSQMQKKLTDAVNALGEKAMKQMAIAWVHQEYEQLGVNLEQLQMSYIVRYGLIMILMTLGSMASVILVGFLASRTAAGAAKQLRRDVFGKVINFTNAEFDTFSTASLITRTTNDITQMQMVTFMSMRMLLFAPIMAGGGVIRALGKAPSMAWIIGLAVLVLIGVIGLVFSIALPKFKLMQKLVDRLNLVARENLSGLMVVRAFNRESFEEQRFGKANQDLTNVSLFVNRVMVIMMPFMMILMNVLSIGIIWVGSHRVADASMQVGDMMAFMQYAIQIVMSFMMLSMMFIMLPRAAISANRIAEVLETKGSITDPAAPVPYKASAAQRGTVEFRDVCFRYPKADTDVLCHISFTAPAGKTTGIIGPTGAGKSTLINLIPRFYDVTSGSILIDGIDIRDMTQKELRSLIGYVPQRSLLFSGTVEENLRFADEGASPERLTEALKAAQADFVLENPEGLSAQVAQGGANFSGGQKQRLAIARALVKDYPIYLFDDSFSALDYRTDARLRRALDERARGSTRIIVAQRVATIMRVDHIIVLDEGRIVGQGTHKELMTTCEAYREIVESQFKGEQIA